MPAENAATSYLSAEFSSIYARLSPENQTHIGRLVRLMALPSKDECEGVDWNAVRARIAGVGKIFGVDVSHELAKSDDELNEQSDMRLYDDLGLSLDWIFCGDVEALCHRFVGKQDLIMREREEANGAG